jgi:hypothetical protein
VRGSNGALRSQQSTIHFFHYGFSSESFGAELKFPFGAWPFRRRCRSVGIKEVIETINRMQAAGVIERYAIGGAVAATFYLEPVATLDVDVFVEFHTEPGSQIISPEPIFRYLRDRGCEMEGEHVVIGGWPIQFVPAGSALVQEALAKAVEKDVEGTPARVITAEHLAAIALETGRAKDKARVLQFIEADAIDLDRLQEILTRHGLAGAWQQFERQFLK